MNLKTLSVVVLRKSFASKVKKIMDGLCTDEEKYLYTGPELSVSEAKAILSKFSSSSGSVDLNMDVGRGLASVCLNNPTIKNAINGKMMADLDEIVDKLKKWNEGKGVIVYGADGNFCSGGDLNFAKQISNPELGYAMSTYMNHVLENFKRLPMITVAYIDGTGALGGGAEVTTACDYRLMCSATPRVTGVGFVHAKMGIVPAWGSTGRLMSIVGPQRALDLLLDSRPLTAAEATAAGLVDGVAATYADAVEWLSRKVRHAADVVRAVKRMRLCHLDCDDPERRLAVALTERKIFAPLWGGPANREALDRRPKHNTTASGRGTDDGVADVAGDGPGPVSTNL